MIIKPVHWLDIEPGSMVLCSDFVLREIGGKGNILGTGLCRRKLGAKGGWIENRANETFLVIEPDDESINAGSVRTDVAILFQRAGFPVELLPL